MYASLQRMMRSHTALLGALTALVLGLLSVQVSSMQSVVGPYQQLPDPFKLKNPNAFDPAKRRSVRAMKEPAETAELLATGLDAAERSSDPAPERMASDQPPEPPAANSAQQ